MMLYWESDKIEYNAVLDYRNGISVKLYVQTLIIVR